MREHPIVVTESRLSGPTDVRSTTAAACAARLRVRLGLEEERVMRVLCATDLLLKTEAAIERAYQLSTQLDAGLSLLHVIQSFADPREPEEKLRRTMARLMCRRPWPGGRELPEVLVRSGNPAQVLMEMADQLSAGLVVLGTHRKRFLRRALANNVAESLLRDRGCPVLLVRHEPKGPYRNVLLAANASETSARAIRAAEAWVLNDGATATIMVSNAPTYEQLLADTKARGQSGATNARRWRAEARAMLENSLKRVSVDDSRYAVLIEEARRPAVAIRRVVEQMRPDLLVMGTRGRARWCRALFGSVASQVLRTVNCDVMVVPDGSTDRSLQFRASDLGPHSHCRPMHSLPTSRGIRKRPA